MSDLPEFRIRVTPRGRAYETVAWNFISATDPTTRYPLETWEEMASSIRTANPDRDVHVQQRVERLEQWVDVHRVDDEGNTQ